MPERVDAEAVVADGGHIKCPYHVDPLDSLLMPVMGQDMSNVLQIMHGGCTAYLVDA